MRYITLQQECQTYSVPWAIFALRLLFTQARQFFEYKKDLHSESVSDFLSFVIKK